MDATAVATAATVAIVATGSLEAAKNAAREEEEEVS